MIGTHALSMFNIIDIPGYLYTSFVELIETFPSYGFFSRIPSIDVIYSLVYFGALIFALVWSSIGTNLMFFSDNRDCVYSILS